MSYESSGYFDIIRELAKPLAPMPTGVAPRIQKLPGIRAVLFDIYGTMLISGCGEVGTVSTNRRDVAVADAFRAVSAPLLGSPERVVELLDSSIRSHQRVIRDNGEQYPEIDIVEIWTDVIDSLTQSGHVDSAKIEAVDPAHLAIEYEMRANPVWPMPGLENCLQRLRQSERLLGIISNAQFFTELLFPPLLDKSLGELGFDSKLTLYSFQHGAAKPSRRLFEIASRLLTDEGVAPTETLYIGNDMLNDVAAAANIGFRTALFAGDARSLRLRKDDPRVSGIKPDVTLTELSQLLDCV